MLLMLLVCLFYLVLYMFYLAGGMASTPFTPLSSPDPGKLPLRQSTIRLPLTPSQRTQTLNYVMTSLGTVYETGTYFASNVLTILRDHLVLPSSNCSSCICIGTTINTQLCIYIFFPLLYYIEIGI